MMQMYIQDTLITKILEVMYNGTTKSKILKICGFKNLCQDTVGEWRIKIGFKYDYAVNNYYVDDHEKRIRFGTYGNLLTAIYY